MGILWGLKLCDFLVTCILCSPKAYQSPCHLQHCYILHFISTYIWHIKDVYPSRVSPLLYLDCVSQSVQPWPSAMTQLHLTSRQHPVPDIFLISLHSMSPDWVLHHSSSTARELWCRLSTASRLGQVEVSSPGMDGLRTLRTASGSQSQGHSEKRRSLSHSGWDKMAVILQTIVS